MVERRADAPLLEVRDLVKHFPLPHTLLDVALRRVPEHIRAVDGVSFTLERGRTLGLVGESGCGKSTLGRCLLRLHDPDRGAVLFDGVDLMKLDEAGLAPYRKRMQVVFQDPYASLNPRQRVDRMLREVLDVHDIGAPSERRRRVDELLVQVGLARPTATSTPASSRAGSASESASPGRWPWSPSCSSPTSLCRPWTSRSRLRSCSSSSTSGRRSG